MQPDDLIHQYGVSREMAEKLRLYHELLLKWQKAINLISSSTINDAWSRHFIDSMQVARYIPEGTKIIADLGSGAGFPGLVLAIMRPEIEVHLVESDERKAQFLRTVSRETTAASIVHNMRIEEAYAAVKPDVITARALASLNDLCAYVMPWAEQNLALQMLFMKGENAPQEIKFAQKQYKFDVEGYQSETSKQARILHLRNLRPT